MNRITAILAGLVALGVKTEASAGTPSELASRSIAIACGGSTSATPIGRETLAEALLAAYSVAGSRVAQSLIDRRQRAGSTLGVITADDLRQEALRLVVEPTPLGQDANSVRGSVEVIADRLTGAKPGSGSPLTFDGTGRFSFSSSDGTLRCEPAAPAGETRPPVLAVRGTVEELAEERKDDASGSFEGSFDRTRTTDGDGQRTVTRSFSVRGAVGLRPLSKLDALVLYADYALDHVRKRSGKAGATRVDSGADDDVDALELGVMGTTAAGPVRIIGRAGTVFDFETGARRLRGTLVIRPAIARSIGPARAQLCGIGIYSSNLLGLPMEARCFATLEVDASHVLRSGSADLKDGDELLAIGGTVGYEFRPALGPDGTPKDGLVGSVVYRYQPVVTGHAPDIDQLEATLKQRWWAGKLALDLGLTYADGIERKGLVDENRLSLTLGLLF